MKTSKAYRFRFYPTAEQAQLLSRTFGCVRYVYNWALKAKTDAYYNEGQRIYYKDMSAQLTVLKQQPETVWLNEVSSVALQQELRHLDRAFIWMLSFSPLGRRWEIHDSSARMRNDLPRLKNVYLKNKKAPRTATRQE